MLNHQHSGFVCLINDAPTNKKVFHRWQLLGCAPAPPENRPHKRKGLEGGREASRDKESGSSMGRGHTG